MAWEKVTIELLQPKVYHRHYVLPKGSMHSAWIQPDGTAQLYKYPMVKVDARHYRLYIPEQAYDFFFSTD